jgi:radical SAM protein with 4Fe4S-binding SPASM domain
MHHGNARGLVAHLKALRISKPEYEDMEFGLISNVSSLMDAVTDEDFANDLLRTMSYIRWSWPEDGEGIKKLRVAYIDQLTRFLKLNPSSRRSRVGVKILATRQNTHGGKYTEIISLIENLFDIGIDHVKVRTLRPSMLQRKQGAADETASEADLNSCEARAEDLRGLADSLLHLEETLRKNDKISGDKSLEVDVATRYVPNDYKCYLSPLVMVIDPHGDVRMCWNDVEDKQRIIGNAIKSDLADIWGKARHRKVCTEMSASNVCNGRSGCHCRIVGYQADAEKFFGTSVALGGPFPEPRFRDKFV